MKFSTLFLFSVLSLMLSACGGGGGGSSDNSSSSTADAGTNVASANANAGSSYTNSRPDIWIDYFSLSLPPGAGDLKDAIAYLDANGDGDTDVFMATGEYLLNGEVNSALFINQGATFVSSTAEFAGNMPPATHARKSLVADFDGNGLDDIFVLDHGFDSSPFPGSNPKLIMQNSVGSFSWEKLSDQTGFHHGGAAADIDNDGDIDIFVGGFDPFFYINNGSASFSVATNLFDSDLQKVFSAELIDIDEDGFVDLLVGAHERDGDKTSIYWGSASGAYSDSNRTLVAAVNSFGAVLDFDAEDIDGDGDRDLVINRTRDGIDGALGFYQGRTLQLLQHDGNRVFVDVTATNIDLPGGDIDNWFPWVRLQDIDNDGDIDLGSDDSGDGVTYLNEAGFFTKQ